MLDIRGQKVKLWVTDHDGTNGKWQSYSISFSKKVDNGRYVNKSVKVFLGKDVERPAHVENGTLIDFEGFPTLDIYTDRDGNERKEVAVFITKIDWGDEEDVGFSEVVEGFPF